MTRLAAFAIAEPQNPMLRYFKQLGVQDIVLVGGTPTQTMARFPVDQGDQPGMAWGVDDLVAMRQCCEDRGLRAISMENPLPAWCLDRIKLGLPGRDQQIENVITTIRNMARAEIPVYGYHWMVNPPGMLRASWRTAFDIPVRGDATVERFDWDIAKALPLFRDRVYSEEEMWEYYAYFIRAITPTLAETGVKIAVHPDDPPIEQLGGVPRLFRNVAGFQRALDLADSPYSGLNFCLGNWTAMGADIPAAIRHFGATGQIFYGHLQGVRGTVPTFQECFLDEADCDFLTVVQTFEDIGLDISLAPGHFPHTLNDTPQQHQGYAFAFGFMKGLLAQVRGGAG